MMRHRFLAPLALSVTLLACSDPEGDSSAEGGPGEGGLGQRDGGSDGSHVAMGEVGPEGSVVAPHPDSGAQDAVVQEAAKPGQEAASDLDAGGPADFGPSDPGPWRAFLFHRTESARPGDVILLQGAGFAANSPQVLFSDGHGFGTTLPVLAAGPTKDTLLARIPAGAPLSLYAIKVSDGQGGFSPVEQGLINRARVLHYDTPEIAAGSKFKVYGRNLLLSGFTPRVRLVDAVDGSSADVSVDVTESTSYVLTVTAPSSVVAGHRYELHASNGSGGAMGETQAALSLQGRSGGADPWQLGLPWGADFDVRGNRYNVRTDSRLTHHAVGDGSSNDAPALQEAIDAASRDGGGEVLLPAGTYKLVFDPDQQDGLSLRSHVVLAGSGRDTTLVRYGYGTPGTRGGLGYGVHAHNASFWGIADLALENVDESGHWANNLLTTGTNEEVFLQRIRLRSHDGNQLWLGAELSKLAVLGSEFEQIGIAESHDVWLGAGSDFVFRGNSVRLSGGEFASLGAGDHRGVIEHNHFTRDLSSQRIPNTRGLEVNFVADIAIVDNDFDVVGGTAVATYNDGETINTEGGGNVRRDELRGTVTAGGPSMLTDSNRDFSSLTGVNQGATVALVHGTGMGQWRRLVARQDKALTVDRPWDVVPDATSHYTIFDWSAQGLTIANNRMQDNEKGILLYQSSVRDVLIRDNQMKDNAGVLITPAQLGGSLFSVVYDVQVSDNVLENTKKIRPSYIAAVPRQFQETQTFGTSVLGLDVRRNSIAASTPNTQGSPDDENSFVGEGYTNSLLYQSLTPYQDDEVPALLGSIFQDNVALHCDHGLFVNTGSYQTVLAPSTKGGAAADVRDSTLSGATHASRGTLSLP